MLQEAFLSFLGLGVQPPDGVVGHAGLRGRAGDGALPLAGGLPRPGAVAHAVRASTSSATACATRSIRTTGRSPLDRPGRAAADRAVLAAAGPVRAGAGAGVRPRTGRARPRAAPRDRGGTRRRRGPLALDAPVAGLAASRARAARARLRARALPRARGDHGHDRHDQAAHDPRPGLDGRGPGAVDPAAHHPSLRARPRVRAPAPGARPGARRREGRGPVRAGAQPRGDRRRAVVPRHSAPAARAADHGRTPRLAPGVPELLHDEARRAIAANRGKTARGAVRRFEQALAGPRARAGAASAAR